MDYAEQLDTPFKHIPADPHHDDFWWSDEADAAILAAAMHYDVHPKEIEKRLEGSIPGTRETTPRQAIDSAARYATESDY